MATAIEIITEHIVYVAREDLNDLNKLFPRDTTKPVAVFPRQDQRGDARTSLQILFETSQNAPINDPQNAPQNTPQNTPQITPMDAPIIPLFELLADATRRVQHITETRTREINPRILEVNLVEHLYRELRQFVQEVEYTGPMPRIDGRAFLVFARLRGFHRPKEKEEEVDQEKKKKKEKETERGRGEKKNQRRDRTRSARGADKDKRTLSRH